MTNRRTMIALRSCGLVFAVMTIVVVWLLWSRAVSVGTLSDRNFSTPDELLVTATKEFWFTKRGEVADIETLEGSIKGSHRNKDGENHGFVTFMRLEDSEEQWTLFISEDCTQYIEKSEAA